MPKPLDPDNSNTFLGTNENGDVVLLRAGIEVLKVDSSNKLTTIGDLRVLGDTTLEGAATVAAVVKSQAIPVAAMFDKVGSEPTQVISGSLSCKAFTPGGALTTAIVAQVPTEWDAASDLSLDLYWLAEPGTVMAETETVKFTATYRGLSALELSDQGSAVAASVTYTEPNTTAGADTGIDKELQKSTITIDHDHASQVLAAGDLLAIALTRGVDTYAGDVLLACAVLRANVTGID